MTVQVRVPGKLFLAGEYAVVEAGYPALIAAINRFLTVSVEESSQGSVTSSQQGLTVAWQREGEQLLFSEAQTYPLVFAAMQMAESYLCSLGQPPSCPYALSIDSQLDDQESGVKYGLGSSGAVTVATIKAVLAFFGQEVSAYRLYQLAALTQVQLGMKGSLGDLASSSYGGVIAYRSVDRSWLKKTLEAHSLTDVLEMPWKGLAIERIQLPQDLSLLVGWTGRAASTEGLVSQMGQGRQEAEKEDFYQNFLAASQTCLAGLIEACREDDARAFREGIAENRRLLQAFASQMNLVIETPALARLCQLAEEAGAVAKSSGAGGGDCGICFVTGKKEADQIGQKWQEAGIVPLDFALAHEN
jgi:phosphomevalonate kinase